MPVRGIGTVSLFLLDKPLDLGKALYFAQTYKRDDRRAQSAGVARIVYDRKLRARDIRDDLHPRVVERAAADAADLAAVEAVILLEILEDLSQIVADPLVVGAQRMLAPMPAADVDKRQGLPHAGVSVGRSQCQ